MIQNSNTYDSINFNDRSSTDFLRLVAICLITNSHIDQLYPIKSFGTGGALGVALFFMLSGLCLSLSWQSKKHTPSFCHWYGYRFIRIYAAVWIMMLTYPYLWQKGWTHWTLMTYIDNFLLVRTHWFILAITLFYIPLYGLLRAPQRKVIVFLTFTSLTVLYFIIYIGYLDLGRFCIEDNTPFRWIAYFQIMLFGTCLTGVYQRDIQTHMFSGAPRWGLKLTSLVITVVLFYGIKIAMQKSGCYTAQFILHMLLFPFVYLCLRLSTHPMVYVIWQRIPVASRIMRRGALVTLEIYLVQDKIRMLPCVQHLAFPLNIISFTILTLLAAFLLHSAVRMVQHALVYSSGLNHKHPPSSERVSL